MSAHTEAVVSVGGAVAACLVVALVLAAVAWLVKSWCTDVRKARAAAAMARRYRGNGDDPGGEDDADHPPRSSG